MQNYPITTKVCNRCQMETLTSEFSKRTKSLDGLKAYCKDCYKTYLSNWQDENKEHYNENMRNIYQNNEGQLN